MESIKFSIETKYGTYTDCLHLTPEELLTVDIEQMKQDRVNKWIYNIEHADELAIPKMVDVQALVKDSIKNLEFVHRIIDDPNEGIASLENIKVNTLYCLESNDFIFLGSQADIKQVNENYCSTNTIPVVRHKCLGGAFLYEKGKNILIYLITSSVVEEVLFRRILMETFKELGVTDITMKSNDLLVNGKQVGMTAPPVQLDSGMWYVGGQITFGVDFNKVENCLSFAESKWFDKGNITSIRDWISPVSNIKQFSILKFIETLTNIIKGF